MRIFPIAVFSLLAFSLGTANATRPNIVIIMADDMGFSDISCYGGEIATPHLDALADGGLRFTQFYNTGRCCPTRASLLTGLYSHQAGIGHMTGDSGVPGYRGALNDRCVTIGRVAQSAGYLSAVSGKWHVGHKERSMWPLARGFDRFYGVPEGGGFYFQLKGGRSIVLNDKVIASPEKPLPEGWYSTDAFTDHGLKFIDQAIAADKPFLLYLAHNAPHFPLQADAEDIEKYRGKFRAGWDELADARYRRQVEMGLIDASMPRAPRPEGVLPWSEVSEKEKDRFDHLMASYAATIYRMDQSVGRLVAGLKERGQFDNTLILFLSDNGASAEGGTKGRTEGDPTTAKSNWYAGKSWAWLSNVPFRRFKKNSDEGGIATPLIAHWPAGIETGRGREGGTGSKWVRTPTHVIDLMATVVELTGADYPVEVEGRQIVPMEGVSLVPLLTVGGSQSLSVPASPRLLAWEHEGNAAVRVGDWKAVRVGGKSKWELFDLSTDRTEQTDVSGRLARKHSELVGHWQEWAQRCGVSPNGLPRKKKAK